MVINTRKLRTTRTERPKPKCSLPNKLWGIYDKDTSKELWLVLLCSGQRLGDQKANRYGYMLGTRSKTNIYIVQQSKRKRGYRTIFMALKEDLILLCKFETYAELDESLMKWIKSYNEDFPNSAIVYQPPNNTKENYTFKHQLNN